MRVAKILRISCVLSWRVSYRRRPDGSFFLNKPDFLERSAPEDLVVCHPSHTHRALYQTDPFLCGVGETAGREATLARRSKQPPGTLPNGFRPGTPQWISMTWIIDSIGNHSYIIGPEVDAHDHVGARCSVGAHPTTPPWMYNKSLDAMESSRLRPPPVVVF